MLYYLGLAPGNYFKRSQGSMKSYDKEGPQNCGAMSYGISLKLVSNKIHFIDSPRQTNNNPGCTKTHWIIYYTSPVKLYILAP